MSSDQATFYHLGVALAIGLLIGVERGWSERGEQEGSRIAGVRTFALIGLLGGSAALVAPPLGVWIPGIGLLALGVLLATAHVVHAQARRDQLGITGPVAALLTFVLGALAASGAATLAAAGAVVAALLLSSKPALHRWLGTLSRDELSAGLQLLLLSVVVLPLLPDQGYGPWKALNPHRIWWMVVLIAAISFVGYFAVKTAGARKGSLFTGLFGGLSSSTALTLQFSRNARSQPDLGPLFATGILLACGTMLPRMGVILGVIAPALLPPALPALTLMSLTLFGVALIQWRRLGKDRSASATPLTNPLELRVAIGFGALLALILVLAKGVESWLGNAGVLALSAVSGIADVDAITISLGGMSQADLDPRIAVTGIIIAAASNCLVKGGMALAIGGPGLALPVALPLAIAATLGPLWVWITFW